MNPLRSILGDPRYFGPVWVFASLNIPFGKWAIHIPSVKDKLGIGNADLGIPIFLSLGIFTILPTAAKIINKIGVGRATSLGVLCIGLMALLPLFAPNYYMLMGSLYLFGAFNGLADIPMNTLVTEIEKKDKRKFMSAAHGFFSLGGLGGFYHNHRQSAPAHAFGGNPGPFRKCGFLYCRFGIYGLPVCLSHFRVYRQAMAVVKLFYGLVGSRQCHIDGNVTSESETYGFLS